MWAGTTVPEFLAAGAEAGGGLPKPGAGGRSWWRAPGLRSSRPPLEEQAPGSREFPRGRTGRRAPRWL